MKERSLSIVLFILLVFSISYAAVPTKINYQGYLTDASGTPINGNVNILFRIYSSPSTTTSLWSETQNNISVTDGYFSALLGSVTAVPASVFDGSDRYLGVKVGSDPELTPRKILVSVGYSFQADKVDGKDAADFVQKVDGVSPNSSGNIDLVAGSNVTITPGTNKITISASVGSGGDNLGNHTATENIKLNNKYLSNDGGNEGIKVDNNGNVTASGWIKAGNPSEWTAQNGDILAANDVQADGSVWAKGKMVTHSDLIVRGHTGIHTGNPHSTYELYVDGTAYATADVQAHDDLICDDDLICKDHAVINGTTGNPAYALYVNGSSYSTVGWYSSDRIFKKNISSLQTPLNKVLQLEGVSYQWRRDEYKDREFPEGRHLGFIAQDIEKVLPEAVRTDENGEKAINYNAIIPLLVEGMKQQQKVIEELQRNVEQLQKR